MYTPDVTLQNVLFRCSLQAHITKAAKRDHYIFYFFYYYWVIQKVSFVL